MSRAKPADNSATVSLFPFLAVLLCTMGALLVVLVAVSRTAREHALRSEDTAKDSETAPDLKTAQSRDQIKAFESFIAVMRGGAEKNLREDEKRMSHLEAHMRELHERLKALHLAAAELAALEDEHYDDHEQAQRELERLEKLIADTRSSIESLKEEAGTRKKSYALVPCEGPNRTFRRPIYIECRGGELILQPEGVRITLDDLRPPLGAGNPLAAALRAAREHYAQQTPSKERNRDTEPYALLIVRPSGAAMNHRAQEAIRAADLDFGYELFEEDSEVQYEPPDPQLALVEEQAIQHARIRQEALAAAAPRAFRHTALAKAGRFEFDEPSMGFGHHGHGSGGFRNGSGDGQGQDDGDTDSLLGSGSDGGDGTSQAQSADRHNAGAAPQTNGAGSAGGMHPPEQVHGQATVAADGTRQAENPAEGGAVGASPPDAMASAMPIDGKEQMSGVAVSGGAAPSSTAQSSNQHSNADPNDKNARPVSQTMRGKDWAFRKKDPRAVPISRSIALVVRKDQIAILSDEARLRSRRLASKTIPLQGDTVESIDELVRIVHEQVDSWGIAGEGLYWRPVLTLHVAPNGRERAEDLARLLKDSGLEIRPAATATHTPQGDTRATYAR
ncbi:MAG TPA: hypothetical protein VJ828_09090 [Lacipirellulaceae bacterium]|nr:hypothetical protein [Lacipirellulaceae bacterium]